MIKTWTTEIDSDIGQLRLTVDYHYEGGSKGDHDTPSHSSSVEIQDVSILIHKVDNDMLDHICDEILEHEEHHDPEDYRD